MFHQTEAQLAHRRRRPLKAAPEGVMRRFTKRIFSLGQLSCAEHLSSLNAFSLEDMRTCADMSVIYKFVHGHAGDLSVIE